MKISFIITAYHHERFVRMALESAFAQTRPADEIIVIDDASGDRTAAVIATTLQGRPEQQVTFIRNEANLGVTGSVAKAVAAASGDVIVFMAADDVSAPGRLGRCLAHLESHPGTMAIVTNAQIIDQESRELGMLDNCAGARVPAALGLGDLSPGDYFLRGRSSCGATAAYRAEVFRRFSPLRAGIYAEDDPLAFRAMLLGTCDFLPEALVRWRRHGHNLSHGAGRRRGPELAAHFRSCEAMMDQMISDAAEWAGSHPEAAGRLLVRALPGLRFQKAKWKLWSAAFEGGVRLGAFLSATAELVRHRPSWAACLREAWRPACAMLMPFPLQRAIFRQRPL